MYKIAPAVFMTLLPSHPHCPRLQTPRPRSPPPSDIKPDDLLLKGSRTKEKSRDKKASKDKRKGQVADGLEKKPSKARVDELLVRQPHARDA